jgi:hypothetical protein
MWHMRALVLAPFIASIHAWEEGRDYTIYPRQATGTIVNPLDPALIVASVPVATPLDPDLIIPTVPANTENPTLIDVISECSGAGTLVTSCGLTQQEWQAFDIDSFLADAIARSGPEVSFPTAFAFAHRGPGAKNLNPFQCSTIDPAPNEDMCVQPVGFSSEAVVGNSCLFAPLRQQQLVTSACLEWTDPKAVFVVENYLSYRRTLRDQAIAIADARNLLRTNNFVNVIVDGTAEEKGSIFDKILEFFATIPLEIITSPFKGVLKGVKKVIGNLDTIDPSLDILPSATDSAADIFSTISNNAQIGEDKEKLKALLEAQLDTIVGSQRANLEKALDAVYGNPNGRQGRISVSDARNTVPFVAADGGSFLSPQPSLQTLTDDAEKQLKNWVITSIVSGMGWDLILDDTELLDDPADPGGACRGNKGISGLGARCALFRRKGVNGEDARFDSPRMNDPTAIGQQVDIRALLANAQECGGGQAQPDVDGAGDLPRCTYNFRIANA